ncbi:MAG: S41 family peptidase [Prevotellaceae bacterium]|nr:S41 family peptidase [Candidatus Colivivens caballi]
MKNHRLTSLIAVCAMSCTLCANAQSQTDDDHAFDVSSQLDILHTAYRTLDALYVDTLDAKKLISTGIRAMFHSLDPYTEYYPQEDEKELKMLTQAKYGGIGSIIRQMKDSTVIIAEPYEGMPADEVGLQAGDILLKIDDKDLKGVPSTEVSESLRGEPGTTFVLKFQRPGEAKPRTVKITRQSIKIPCIPYSGLVHGTIGYINLNQFTDDCFSLVRKAVITLKEQGAKSLILDLRGNGGGSLDQAVRIVNLFVPKGLTIVENKGKVQSANMKYVSNDTPLDLDIPIAVLVDGETASASEIVSGSLQDLDRAVIIGNRTYGKGLVQSIRELPYDSHMKLTTAKYYIPSGRCIQEVDYKLRRDQSDSQSAKQQAASQDSIFYTTNHRVVKSGKGITPDITVKLDTLQNITIYLSHDDILVNYATRYCQTHTRPATVSDFHYTDEDYADFKQMVINSDFKYDKLSDKNLEQLKKVAKFEGYYDDAKAEFDALEAKLTHNLEYDLDRCSKDIRMLISLEIAKRWFYERGSIQIGMTDDPVLDRAVNLLGNTDEYNKILGKASE